MKPITEKISRHLSGMSYCIACHGTGYEICTGQFPVTDEGYGGGTVWTLIQCGCGASTNVEAAMFLLVAKAEVH